MDASIVVPLDGSALAETALPWVRILAHRNATKVVIVSVIEVSTEFAAWASADQPSTQAEITDVIDERRAYIEEVAGKYDLEAATIDVRLGAPAREILACASEITGPPPIIVMCTHGYGGFKRLALGSIALQIVHNYSGPIMAIRNETTPEEARLERLLVPVDGSNFSRRAVKRAMELLGEPYPQLHLVRVLGTPTWASRSINHGLVAEYLEASREWSQEQLDELRDETAATGYEVTSELRPHGNVVDEIIDAANTSGADVIAMCTHGMGGIGRIVMGSTADGVLRHTTHPVLLLRPDTED